MKKYRIIWCLADGRKKYSTSGGVPELWTPIEMKCFLNRASSRGAYTPDLKTYGSYEGLKALGFEGVARINRHEQEEADLPLTEGILL